MNKESESRHRRALDLVFQCKDRRVRDVIELFNRNDGRPTADQWLQFVVCAMEAESHPRPGLENTEGQELRCKTCKWWNGDPDPKYEMEEAPCTRHAPSSAYRPPDRGNHGMTFSVWPMMRAGNGCGDHVERKKTDDG